MCGVFVCCCGATAPARMRSSGPVEAYAERCCTQAHTFRCTRMANVVSGVAADVELFCGTQHSQQQHDEALARIDANIVARAYGLTEVVAALGAFLANTQELLRARGTLLLSSLLDRLPPDAGYIDASQKKFLLAL